MADVIIQTRDRTPQSPQYFITCCWLDSNHSDSELLQALALVARRHLLSKQSANLPSPNTLLIFRSRERIDDDFLRIRPAIKKPGSFLSKLCTHPVIYAMQVKTYDR